MMSSFLISIKAVLMRNKVKNQRAILVIKKASCLHRRSDRLKN
uniref:Uncharacterized protein n=1 Tax=uncultured bacterium BLR12 TaxID=506514 RepID=C0INF5_9BACT|nr:hypothetical protein AKSOIL_0226 [uncultured bacterium BLR12]